MKRRNDHPKPLAATGQGTAVINVEMWAKPGYRLWAYHDGEKFNFRTCQQARDWAKERGYRAVRFHSDANKNG